MTSIRRISVLLFSAMLLGCSSVPGWLQKSPVSAGNDQRSQLGYLQQHLQLMRDITRNDYQDQVKVFTQTEKLLAQNDNIRNQLRHALLLATTGHPNTNTGKGYSELKSILDQPGELSPVEINLAIVVLNEVESLMILQARNAELDNLIAKTKTEINKSGQSNRESLLQAQQQLSEAQIEIEALKFDLLDAQQKLDAIKRIEVTSE